MPVLKEDDVVFKRDKLVPIIVEFLDLAAGDDKGVAIFLAGFFLTMMNPSSKNIFADTHAQRMCIATVGPEKNDGLW